MDVRSSAAGDLTAQLRRAADVLDSQTAVRRRLGADARGAWAGAAAATYDDELRRLVARSASVAEACRRAAAVSPAGDPSGPLERRGRFS